MEAKVGPDYTNVGGGVQGELRGKERKQSLRKNEISRSLPPEPCHGLL